MQLFFQVFLISVIGVIMFFFAMRLSGKIEPTKFDEQELEFQDLKQKALKIDSKKKLIEFMELWQDYDSRYAKGLVHYYNAKEIYQIIVIKRKAYSENC